MRSVNVHWCLLEVGGLECPVAQANVLLIVVLQPHMILGIFG